MALAKSDQWHPGNAEALGDEAMSIMNHQQAPPWLRWARHCSLRRTPRQARLSLPYKKPRIFPVHYGEGSIWSLKRRPHACMDWPVFAQLEGHGWDCGQSWSIRDPHPSLQQEEALSPAQWLPWPFHILPPVVPAAADARYSITSTPAHRLFQRSPMCTFHLILKITCF